MNKSEAAKKYVCKVHEIDSYDPETYDGYSANEYLNTYTDFTTGAEWMEQNIKDHIEDLLEEEKVLQHEGSWELAKRVEVAIRELKRLLQ